MPNALEAAEVSVFYGEVEAVKRISLHCARGEIVAILGANAAGKSSLLKAIAGLVDYRGSISYLGEEIDARSSADRVRRGVCLVPEQREVFPNLTVEENLLLGAYRAQGGRARRHAEMSRMLDLFDSLARRRAVAAGLLSGGEQQMLAIARSLMAQPSVLLMDEPTLGLAPRVADDIAEAIRDLATTLDGVVIAEQNAVWVLDLCSRVYVLEQGEIVLEGTGAEIVGDARLRAAYLGT